MIKPLVVMPGDIGFTKPKGNLVSNIVSCIISSDYSHVFMVTEGLKTIEALGNHIAQGEMQHMMDDPGRKIVLFRNTKLSDDEKKIALGRARSLIGVDYGWFQIITIGIRALLKRVGLYIPNILRVGLVCNEVPVYSYNILPNCDALYDKDQYSVDISELFDLLVTSPDWLMVYKRD